MVTVRSRRRLPSTKDVRIHGGVAVAVDYGEQKQAVGRSRGGRNTKIHALADAKGRLLAILLTGGEAHDCPEQIEGLQAHRNSLRQAGAKLPGLCLPRRRPCMVDLMSLHPSTTLADFL